MTTTTPKRRKGYLALRPCLMQVTIGTALDGSPIKQGLTVEYPALALLPVYATKKAMREVHGRTIEFMEIEFDGSTDCHT